MAKPALEAAVVGIDVLDVPRAVDAETGGEIDRVMLDLQSPSCSHQGATAVGAENAIRRQNRLQSGDDMGDVIDGKNEVGGSARAVASDPYRHLFFR